MGVGAASSVLMLLAIGAIVCPYLVSEMRHPKHG
jgi:glucose/mannose transport system permease protein